MKRMLINGAIGGSAGVFPWLLPLVLGLAVGSVITYCVIKLIEAQTMMAIMEIMQQATSEDTGLIDGVFEEIPAT